MTMRFCVMYRNGTLENRYLGIAFAELLLIVILCEKYGGRKQ